MVHWIYLLLAFIAGASTILVIFAARIGRAVIEAQDSWYRASKAERKAQKAKDSYEAVLRSMPHDGNVYMRVK